MVNNSNKPSLNKEYNSSLVKSKLFKKPNKNIQFTNQGSDEEVFVVVRSHWIVNWGWAYRAFVNSLIPIVVYAFFEFFQLDYIFKYLSFKEWLLILIFYYSLIITGVFKDFIDWYYDPYFVTSKRLIHFEFLPFTKYKVKEVYFDKIEEISESSSGIIANIFGYGDIVITTSSSQGHVTLKKVYKPTLIRNIITELAHLER